MLVDVSLVGLVIVVAAFEPAVLVQTLPIEQYKTQDRAVVGLIDQLGDVPQVESEDLIAGKLVLLFLGHL